MRAATSGVREVALHEVLGAMDDRAIVIAVAEAVVVREDDLVAAPADEHLACCQAGQVTASACVVVGVVATLLPRAPTLLALASVDWAARFLLEIGTAGLGAHPHAVALSQS